jgi:hypothetical protein
METGGRLMPRRRIRRPPRRRVRREPVYHRPLPAIVARAYLTQQNRLLPLGDGCQIEQDAGTGQCIVTFAIGDVPFTVSAPGLAGDDPAVPHRRFALVSDRRVNNEYDLLLAFALTAAGAERSLDEQLVAAVIGEVGESGLSRMIDQFVSVGPDVRLTPNLQ